MLQGQIAVAFNTTRVDKVPTSMWVFCINTMYFCGSKLKYISCYFSLQLNKKKTVQMDGFFLGRGERTQTFDLSVPNRARYQLRHTPIDAWTIVSNILWFD